MFYFIPDWGNQSDELLNDPLVSLAHLFQDLGASFQILFLLPNNKYRYFLNHNSLLKTHYWSAIDAVLGIKISDGMGLTINEVSLPEQTELRYSGYDISVIERNHIYATIKFSLDGYISEIQYAKQADGSSKSETYDDRGFRLSETTYNENKILISKKWFNEYGQCILIESEDGVDVKPFARSRFKKTHYDSLNSLLTEVTLDYLMKKRIQDQQIKLLTTASLALNSVTKRIQTFFSIYYFIKDSFFSNIEKLQDIILSINGKTTKIFVTNDIQRQKILQITNHKLSDSVQIVSPFATTLALGQSNEMSTKNVVWSIGETTPSLHDYFTTLLKQLQADEELVLVLIKITPQQRTQMIRWLLEWATPKFSLLRSVNQEIIVKAFVEDSFENINEQINQFDLSLGLQSDLLEESGEKEIQMAHKRQQQIEKLIKFFKRIHFKVEFNRQLIFNELNQARILIDLSSCPDLFLQARGISVGIPQIGSILTPYLEPNKNGWLATNCNELEEGLHYFLEGLRHWNEALVANVALIDQFSEESLIHYWEGQLNGDK